MAICENGLLFVNKPVGITSHDVVYKVRKALSYKGVGHTGTLDPMASGLMVLLLGNATKLSEYFLKGNKGYEVQIQLGIETDSYDITGKTLNTSQTQHLTEVQILSKIKELMGHQVLPIPSFSAKKVNGVKLVDMARKGEVTPEIEKDMFFYDLQILNMSSEFVDLSFKCSKGSFVRSWVHQLGKKLQVGAAVSKLNRIYSEPYELSNAVDLESLEKKEIPESAVIPFDQLLQDWPALAIRSSEERLLMNGQIPLILKSQIRTFSELNPDHSKGLRIINQNKKLLSLLEKTGDEFKIKRVFV